MLRRLAKEHGALDWQKTRRASEEWLRDVAGNLCATVMSRALDVMRDTGVVRTFATQEAARAALAFSC